jgi:hypothetical protein
MNTIEKLLKHWQALQPLKPESFIYKATDRR